VLIRRLQPGYKAIGALHSKEEKDRIRFCSWCEEMFGSASILKNKPPGALGVDHNNVRVRLVDVSFTDMTHVFLLTYAEEI
jgi:hypothetical protein